MGRYAVTGQTVAGADLGLLLVSGTTAVRAQVYDILLGSSAAPADAAGEFLVNRNTSDGVGGTAVTPEPLDILTVAATCTSTEGPYGTTQPVDTANTELLRIALNQRATFRWVASPGGELVGPATANSGIFLSSVSHSAAPSMESVFHYME